MGLRRAAEPGRRRALTLIEVVAALALLALVLGAAVSARGRLVRSGVAAREHRLAVEALDAALNDWWAGGAHFHVGLGPGRDDPTGAGRTGTLRLIGVGDSTRKPPRTWGWRSVAVEEPQLVPRGLLRVRITARPDDHAGSSTGTPLVVDVLVPLGAVAKEAAP